MMQSNESHDAQAHSLGLVGIGNGRELGGYRTADGREVRRGVLLRTAAPEGATEEDRRRLEHDLHLTTVLDFRMDMELQILDGSARGLDFADTYRIGILDEDFYMRMLGDRSMEEILKMSPVQMIMEGVSLGMINEHMYVGFLEADTGKRGYAEVFARLLAQPQGEALLFHCTQGKDRTGLAAMLILSTLGVDEETIVSDYLLTNTFNAGLIERERQGLLAAGIPEEQLDRYMIGFDKVYPQSMQNALDHLKATYGSVRGYVHDALGVSEDACEELRDKYLVASLS